MATLPLVRHLNISNPNMLNYHYKRRRERKMDREKEREREINRLTEKEREREIKRAEKLRSVFPSMSD